MQGSKCSCGCRSSARTDAGLMPLIQARVRLLQPSPAPRFVEEADSRELTLAVRARGARALVHAAGGERCRADVSRREAEDVARRRRHVAWRRRLTARCRSFILTGWGRAGRFAGRRRHPSRAHSFARGLLKNGRKSVKCVRAPLIARRAYRAARLGSTTLTRSVRRRSSQAAGRLC